MRETKAQHLAVSQRIINNYRGPENDKVMNKVIKNNEKYIEKLYDEAVAEEKRWATYLFSKGSMVGLSEKLLHNYVEWTANKRMKAIGLKPKYDQVNQIRYLGLNIGLIAEFTKRTTRNRN